jgi:hypothetical protein
MIDRLDRLFELGIRASARNAWTPKNLIFALLFVLYEDQLRFDWEGEPDSLEAVDGTFLCLSYTLGSGTRTLKLPTYRLSGSAAAFFVRRAIRGGDPESKWLSLQRLFRRHRPAPLEPASERGNPEIEQIWSELLTLVGPPEIELALKQLNINRIQLEEIRQHVPSIRAA